MEYKLVGSNNFVACVVAFVEVEGKAEVLLKSVSIVYIRGENVS